MTGLSLLLLAALQIADIILTTRILKRGGRELNGIVAQLMAATGNGWFAAKYAVGMGAAIFAVTAGYGNLVWFINAVMVVVVAHNFIQLRNSRR